MGTRVPSTIHNFIGFLCNFFGEKIRFKHRYSNFLVQWRTMVWDKIPMIWDKARGGRPRGRPARSPARPQMSQTPGGRPADARIICAHTSSSVLFWVAAHQLFQNFSAKVTLYANLGQFFIEMFWAFIRAFNQMLLMTQMKAYNIPLKNSPLHDS